MSQNGPDRLDRRALLKRAAALGMTVAGGAIGAVSVPQRAAAAGSLTVALYGGRFGEAVRAAGKPFADKNGVEIREDEGASTVTLSKLRQQKGNPTIDIAWMDGGVSEIAMNEGLVEPIDLSQISSTKELYPAAIHRDKSGNVYALTGGFYAIGMTYNKQKISVVPTSWKDLVRPEYRGKLTTASPANATWPSWFAHVVRVYGGTLDKPDPFIEAMKKTKVVAYWDSAGQADNLYQSGEALVGVHVSGNVWGLEDKGLPMVYVVPKEGAIAGDVRAHIVKGTKNRALVHKYLEGVTSAAGQVGFVDVLYLAPANKTTRISAKARPRMPYGATGSMSNLAIPDWVVIDQHKTEWTETWNKNVVANA